MAATRIERDSMGEVAVPAEAYWGAQTARAREHFQISGLRLPPAFTHALGRVKAACARVNAGLGLLEPAIADAIERAALVVAEGRLDGEFVLDVFQTGSGTSTNMNANEVIANRALELLGRARGDRATIHPNDHVNRSQSSNDVFPTAMHLAAYDRLVRGLVPAMEALGSAFDERAVASASVVKPGRTHLQGAVPVTLGQELSGYAAIVRAGIARIEAGLGRLAEVPIGGTAVGTGLGAPSEFGQRVVEELVRATGLPLRVAPNRFAAMQSRDAVVEVSGTLRTLATGLMKIANDLRLLASDASTGFGEITLPALQPGSSIMPGKVNPVVPEAVNQVAALVIGHDATIAVAGLNGSLELNVMMPVMAHALLESIAVLASACRTLAEHCVAGLAADAARCRMLAERSPALVTALAPRLGYDRAAALYHMAVERNLPLREVLATEAGVPAAELDRLLDVDALTRGGRTEPV
jgi:fumarate hydratase class II